MSIYKVLRLCSGMSVSILAKNSGISEIYLRELESGKKSNPSTEVLQKIADAYGIKRQTIEFFLNNSVEFSDISRHLLTSLEEYAEENPKWTHSQ